jgi:hypothetical protein
MYGARIGAPIQRGWHRLLDGDRRWGSIDVHPDRFGMTRYRLVVFPPGISEPERRRVRLARGWPMWGALVWVACEIWFTDVTGPWTALVLSTAALVAFGLAAMATAGAARSQVKTMAATVSALYPDPRSAARRDKLGKLALTLTDADERLERGQISPVDHELTWWQVYDEIESRRGA